MEHEALGVENIRWELYSSTNSSFHYTSILSFRQEISGSKAPSDMLIFIAMCHMETGLQDITLLP